MATTTTAGGRGEACGRLARWHDDLLVAEPHPFGEHSVAIHAQRLAGRLGRVGLILVEPTTARDQLATARRATLEVAAGMVPAATEHAAVAAPIAPRLRAVLATEGRHLETTASAMEGIDDA